jgi:ketosteroid isomerase-like protein
VTASKNLDLVRSIYADWKRDYFGSAAWADPEIEWVMADGPAPGTRKGVADMAEGWRDFLGAWKDFRITAEEFHELDGERVLVLGHYTGRGKTSGLEVADMQTSGGGLWHIRSGKVTRIVFYLDRAHALADAGLEE